MHPARDAGTLEQKRETSEAIILSKYHCRILSKRFHRVVAVSENIRNHFLREYRFPEGKVDTIHNGTDLPAPCRKKEIGRFRDRFGRSPFSGQGLPLMVRVAREIFRRNSEARFELAGDGPRKRGSLD
jgi:glycosyltransferase involved in cell wall biosynthesis